MQVNVGGVQNMLGGGGARMKLGGAHPPRKSASGLDGRDNPLLLRIIDYQKNASSFSTVSTPSGHANILRVPYTGKILKIGFFSRKE